MEELEKNAYGSPIYYNPNEDMTSTPKDWKPVVYEDFTITCTTPNDSVTLHIPFIDVRRAMELLNETLISNGIKSFIKD